LLRSVSQGISPLDPAPSEPLNERGLAIEGTGKLLAAK
jgi:hypothetical protein